MKAIKRFPVELNPDIVTRSIIYSFTQQRAGHKPVKMLRMLEMNRTIFALKMLSVILYPSADARDCGIQGPKAEEEGVALGYLVFLPS